MATREEVRSAVNIKPHRVIDRPAVREVVVASAHPDSYISSVAGHCVDEMEIRGIHLGATALAFPLYTKTIHLSVVEAYIAKRKMNVSMDRHARCDSFPVSFLL